MLTSVHLVLTVSSCSSALPNRDYRVGYIVREASDPQTQRIRAPAPVEHLWRDTGPNHVLSMLGIDCCSFMSRTKSDLIRLNPKHLTPEPLKGLNGLEGFGSFW